MKNFTQISNVLIRSPKFNVYEYRVLTFLISFNPCYPSHADLAKGTGLNRKTVYRALKSLREKGAIDWRQGAKGRNNHYFVNHKSWE